MLAGALPFNVNNKSNDVLSLKGIKKKGPFRIAISNN